MSIAQRLANDLPTYFKLDSDIVPETEVLETRSDTCAGTRNFAVIGVVSPSTPGGTKDSLHYRRLGKWSAGAATEGRVLEQLIPG